MLASGRLGGSWRRGAGVVVMGAFVGVGVGAAQALGVWFLVSIGSRAAISHGGRQQGGERVAGEGPMRLFLAQEG